MSDAITLRALRIAWSCPQRTSNCRVAAQLRSRAGSSNCVFVGLMTRSVVGTTMKMTAAPTSHPIPAPRNKGQARLHDRGALVARSPLAEGAVGGAGHAGRVFDEGDVDGGAGEDDTGTTPVSRYRHRVQLIRKTLDWLDRYVG